jgi:cell wall-associated NlpC family hydrolase
MKFIFIIGLLLISIAVQSENRPSALKTDEKSSSAVTLTRADIIRFAKTLLGTPYRVASSNPKKGFDCSGFVSYVFRNFKIKSDSTNALM